MTSPRLLSRLVAGLFICATFTTPALANTPEAAGTFIENLGKQTLATISDQALGKEQKQEKLNSLFSQNVDIQWVARFVMGRFWKQATEDQKTRYLKEYETFVINHYTERFTDYTSGTFKVTSTKNDGDNEYTVSMQIASAEGGNQPILVDYRVRNGAGNTFKVFDVIVEGVSLIATQRSEFGSVISNNGIDYLISQLSNKSAFKSEP